jgi:hypothetical protein
VDALRRYPYLPAGTEVVGLLYDVTTGVAKVQHTTAVGR